MQNVLTNRRLSTKVSDNIDFLWAIYVHWQLEVEVPSPWLLSDHNLTVLSREPDMKLFSLSRVYRHFTLFVCPGKYAFTNAVEYVLKRLHTYERL